MSLAPGTRLGPYEVLTPLGAGGMGEVYRARDSRLDRTVALKILAQAFTADPDRRARFEREARAVAALDHPHICGIYDIGHANGLDFLVMPCLDGQTLADRVANGPMPLDQVLRVGAEIADALEAAHRRGIVHRDLKPANIMLARSGVKLLDFGLAKRCGSVTPISTSGTTELATAPPKTAHGTILGTVQYMAPEQVEGKEADARSDTWALGAVIYEMATGRRPFDGDSPASVIGSILKDDPTRLSTSQPLAPITLEHVVERCLAKDPDDRWQSAGDVKRELAWIARTGAAAESGASLTHIESKRTTRWWVLTASLFAAALTMVAAPAWRESATTPVVPAAVRFPISPAANAPLRGAPASVPIAQVSVAPDGRHIAFVAGAPGDQSALWVRPLDATEPRMIAGTEDAGDPFWSPDSRSVAFFTPTKLKRVDIAGGLPQVLCDATTSRGGTWNRDGVIVFSGSGGAATSGLSRISASGGVPSPATSLGTDQGSHRWPAFLPDGRHFLFYVRGTPERRGVYLGSLDSTETEKLFDARFSAVYSPPGYLLAVRDGTVLAYPFDAKETRMTGDPIRLVDRVPTPGTNAVGLSVSDTGVLVYADALTTLSELQFVDRRGHLLGPAIDVGDYAALRLSPNGRGVAFSRGDPQTSALDIWLHDIAKGVSTRFTSDPADDTSPIWSPDGQRIIYRSNRTGNVLLERATSGLERATSGTEGERLLGTFDATMATGWSSDGKNVVFHSQSMGTLSFDVGAVALAENPRPQPEAYAPSFNEVHGSLSPNGRWLAYASDESGKFEVYVQPFPRAGGKSQVSIGGGHEPHWRADGKELFYLGADRKLMAVTVRSATSFESDTPRALFATKVPYLGNPFRNNYDVTADGTRFLINTLVDDDAAPAQINVVMNWTAALRH